MHRHLGLEFDSAPHSLLPDASDRIRGHRLGTDAGQIRIGIEPSVKQRTCGSIIGESRSKHSEWWRAQRNRHNFA